MKVQKVLMQMIIIWYKIYNCFQGYNRNWFGKNELKNHQKKEKKKKEKEDKYNNINDEEKKAVDDHNKSDEIKAKGNEKYKKNFD